MNLTEENGSSYRLLVSIDGRCALADDHDYQRFDLAQSRVANAVLRHAHYGRVDSVLLQRGRRLDAVEPPHLPPCPSPEALPTDDGREWIVEKRWGPEVVRRILEQNGLPYLLSGPESHPTGLRARARRYVNRHRNTRWHIVGAAALVVVMVLTVLAIQTGGRLDGIFTANASAGVKTELPFDARTSFEEPESRQTPDARRTDPAAGAPPDSPAGKGPAPDSTSMRPAGAALKPAAP